MIRSFRKSLAASAAAAGLGLAAACAQETPEAPALPDAPVAVEMALEAPLPADPSAAPALIEATPAAAPAEPAGPLANPDEMADFLNSQQQIRQGVTLTRSVDGKVVEERKETIIYSKDDPVRSTEAAQSPLERLKAAFDRQSMTRKEVYDEARLDFVVADLDRDDQMTSDEFQKLVDGWRETDAAAEPMTRERFVDLIAHDDDAAANAEHAAQARAKFEAIAGAGQTLSRKAYIKAVIADFEALDADNDGLLTGDELLKFRAANRGEPHQQ
jgi:hypothetical protein